MKKLIFILALMIVCSTIVIAQGLCVPCALEPLTSTGIINQGDNTFTKEELESLKDVDGQRAITKGDTTITLFPERGMISVAKDDGSFTTVNYGDENNPKTPTSITSTSTDSLGKVTTKSWTGSGAKDSETTEYVAGGNYYYGSTSDVRGESTTFETTVYVGGGDISHDVVVDKVNGRFVTDDTHFFSGDARPIVKPAEDGSTFDLGGQTYTRQNDGTYTARRSDSVITLDNNNRITQVKGGLSDDALNDIQFRLGEQNNIRASKGTTKREQLEFIESFEFTTDEDGDFDVTSYGSISEDDVGFVLANRVERAAQKLYLGLELTQEEQEALDQLVFADAEEKLTLSKQQGGFDQNSQEFRDAKNQVAGLYFPPNSDGSQTVKPPLNINPANGQIIDSTGRAVSGYTCGGDDGSSISKCYDSNNCNSESCPLDLQVGSEVCEAQSDGDTVCQHMTPCADGAPKGCVRSGTEPKPYWEPTGILDYLNGGPATQGFRSLGKLAGFRNEWEDVQNKYPKLSAVIADIDLGGKWTQSLCNGDITPGEGVSSFITSTSGGHMSVSMTRQEFEFGMVNGTASVESYKYFLVLKISSPTFDFDFDVVAKSSTGGRWNIFTNQHFNKSVPMNIPIGFNKTYVADEVCLIFHDPYDQMMASEYERDVLKEKGLCSKVFTGDRNDAAFAELKSFNSDAGDDEDLENVEDEDETSVGSESDESNCLNEHADNPSLCLS